MRAAFILALLLAGCGRARPAGDNEGVSTNQIERLATPTPAPAVDPQAPARPQPIGLADLDSEGMPDPVCDFTRGGQMLLAATSSDAIARVAGRLLHYNHSSPMGPTGGFFEDRQLSISIGRVGEVAPETGGGGAWPARITITNRRARAQVEMDGVWRCDG